MKLKLSLLFSSIIALSILNSGCSGSGGGTVASNAPLVTKATRETYLSGKQFCETYKEITSKEYSLTVTVPKDYSAPTKGSLQIYAYTTQPFDAKKPSYIYVDGGPGQNTHGLMKDYLHGDYHELRFDQRGLGCSAPENFDIYSDNSMYSSLNNIRDMEEIRKAYKIDKWSVYGVSYGTVPATMYGSKYPTTTVSVVLEGVFGRPDQVHQMDYKAEKMNLVLSGLTIVKRDAFTQLLKENSEDTKAVMSLFFDQFYSDRGMQEMQRYLNMIIAEDGKIDREVIGRIKKFYTARHAKYPNPQQPGAVDENILTLIYCKNLGALHASSKKLEYSDSSGFYTLPASDDDSSKMDCGTVGITSANEEPYLTSDYPVTTPIYYFQGSHDGATMAIGALSHWKSVAKGTSFFLLGQKGGHNPNLTRLENEGTVSSSEFGLFKKAIASEPITAGDLSTINMYLPDQKWILFTDPKQDTSAFENELRGISLKLKNLFSFN
jgi:proline iminopeptidase